MLAAFPPRDRIDCEAAHPRVRGCAPQREFQDRKIHTRRIDFSPGVIHRPRNFHHFFQNLVGFHVHFSDLLASLRASPLMGEETKQVRPSSLVRPKPKISTEF
jgi:hypothetical protein